MVNYHPFEGGSVKHGPDTKRELESDDPDSILGWGQVDKVAKYLVGLCEIRGMALTKRNIDQIIILWSSLSDHDKRSLHLPSGR